MTEVDLYAGLGVSVDRLRNELAAQRAHAERTPPQPIERSLFNSAAFPASGVLGFNMGGPQEGHRWYVRSIAVGGVTPITAEAGRADIFVAPTMAEVLAAVPATGSQPGDGGFIFATGMAASSMNAWRDQTTILPNVSFYGVGDLEVRAGEKLWIVFSSGTSTDVLVANVRINDHETAAYGRERQA